MEALFVSDIHLGDPKEIRYKDFFNLLKRLKDVKPKRLVLLGDIFDLWVAKHSYFVEKHKDLLELLNELVSLGVEIHYFEGNHDLYLSDHFGKRMNFEIHPNELECNWAGVAIRMEHGDLANPNDKGYLFLRSFLRNPFIRLVLSKLPGSWIKKLGEKASEASRKYTDTFNDDSKNVIRSYAEKLAKKRNFEVMITGHTHQLDDHTFFMSQDDRRRSINLGSWFGDIKQALVLSENSEFQFRNITEI